MRRKEYAMRRKEHSASAVKLSFWFPEFCKVVALLRSGKTLADIEELATNDNIFSAATRLRSLQVFQTVSARVSSLPNKYCELFEIGSIDAQKMTVLISIMNTDALDGSVRLRVIKGIKNEF